MYVKPYVENRMARVIQFVIRDVILFVPWEQLQFTNRVEFAGSIEFHRLSKAITNLRWISPYRNSCIRACVYGAYIEKSQFSQSSKFLL